MIRVTLEIIPKGDESKKFVAGSMEIINDCTGTQKRGNYDWVLRGPTSEDGQMTCNDFWDKGKLEGFERKRGWWSCVGEVLRMASTDYDYV